MEDEYWATFSIYDHRRAISRQALILFDRIVVPIPTRTVGDLTQREIDDLDAEVRSLEQRGAAKRVDWDPEEFKAWRVEKERPPAGEREAVARRLVKDPPYLTRLMLKERTDQAVAKLLPEDVISVTAVPVYGSRQQYEASSEDLKGMLNEKLIVDVLLPNIPVPSEMASFNDILRLRDKPAFRASLSALRIWQRQRLRELLEEPDQASVRRAARDFERLITQYKEAVADVKYTKVTTTVTSMLAVGTALTAVAGPVLGTLAAVASPLFSIRSLLRPSWKDLQEKQCFPAGVVLEAEQLA